MTATLTTLQAHALGVLVDCGTADAAEIIRHLLVDGRRLGPVLGGLERRGLIQRTYTGHTYSRHAYYATGEGAGIYRETFGDDHAY